VGHHRCAENATGLIESKKPLAFLKNKNNIFDSSPFGLYQRGGGQIAPENLTNADIFNKTELETKTDDDA
jgi:hypothetical protein